MTEIPPEETIEPIEETENDYEAEIAAAIARIDVLEVANSAKDERILALEAEVARAHARCQELENNSGQGDNTPDSVHFWGRKMFS